MACWLKVSTAVDIKVGPFVDSTDGNTAETGLTITQPDILLGKNGGAFAQKNAAQTLAHESNGWYECALDTTDTNTLGILVVQIHESGALPVWREFMVVPALVWDSFLGADALQVHAVEISNDLITAAAIAAGAIDAATFAAGAINAAAIAADAITAAKVADGTIDAATFAAGAINAAAIATDAITAAKIAADAIGASELAADAVTEIQSGLATSAALATVDGIVDDILLDTAVIGALGAGLTAIPWNASWDAEVQSEATDALNAYDPPTKAELDTAAALLATQASVNTIDDFLDTEMAAVLAAVDTEVAAIKAKTDNLPASPAAVGSAMTLDLTQALDLTPTVETVGDALLAARANGFGKWTLVGTTLTLFANDGTTSLKSFTLDSASSPTSRTP